MYRSQYYNSHYSVTGDYSHGSLENALRHREMMESITNEIVRQALTDYDSIISQRIRDIATEAYKQAIDDFMHALEYDIESVVSVGIEGCGEIFRDKRTQKIISDRIMQEVQKRLNKTLTL